MAKCKICKAEYQKINLKHLTCSYNCMIDYIRNQKQKQWQKEKKIKKEQLKTYSDHLKETQVIFNRYIRLRDKHKPCVSCGKKLNAKYDAGHYYSVGSTPELRFNEDNVHAQCVHCNQYLHGNLLNYDIVGRIGQENFDILNKKRNIALKLTVEELKELQKYYKLKIKTHENN